MSVGYELRAVRTKDGQPDTRLFPSDMSDEELSSFEMLSRGLLERIQDLQAEQP